MGKAGKCIKCGRELEKYYFKCPSCQTQFFKDEYKNEAEKLNKELGLV